MFLFLLVATPIAGLIFFGAPAAVLSRSHRPSLAQRAARFARRTGADFEYDQHLPKTHKVRVSSADSLKTTYPCELSAHHRGIFEFSTCEIALPVSLGVGLHVSTKKCNATTNHQAFRRTGLHAFAYDCEQAEALIDAALVRAILQATDDNKYTITIFDDRVILETKGPAYADSTVAQLLKRAQTLAALLIARRRELTKSVSERRIQTVLEQVSHESGLRFDGLFALADEAHKKCVHVVHVGHQKVRIQLQDADLCIESDEITLENAQANRKLYVAASHLSETCNTRHERKRSQDPYR